MATETTRAALKMMKAQSTARAASEEGDPANLPTGSKASGGAVGNIAAGVADGGTVVSEMLTMPSTIETKPTIVLLTPSQPSTGTKLNNNQIVVAQRKENRRGIGERASRMSARFISYRCRRLRDDHPPIFRFLAPVMNRPGTTP